MYNLSHDAFLKSRMAITVTEYWDLVNVTEACLYPSGADDQGLFGLRDHRGYGDKVKGNRFWREKVDRESEDLCARL